MWFVYRSLLCILNKTEINREKRPGQTFKGTVRPDWICMKVVSLESPLKGYYRCMFLIFYFWSWIFYKSSKFWAAPCKNEPNLLLVRFTVCIESCLPIGWRTFICWKNSLKCCSILVWIAEWWSSSLSSRNPRTIDVTPAFKETVWRKRSQLEHMQTVNQTSRRIGFNSAWSGSGLWSLLKYSRVK